MKLLSLLFLMSVSLMAELEIRGHLDLDIQAYLTRAEKKNASSLTAKQTLEFRYTKNDLSIFVKLYAQEAYADFLETEDKTSRTFARLDELYLRYELENATMQIGKSIKFWGALELENIVDVFNPNELRDDLFKTNALGVWNTSYSYYTDRGELSVIIKLEEPKQKMADFAYVYYLFAQNASYDDALQTSKNINTPSLYLLYSGSTDTEYGIDFAFIYEHGYDSQRYFFKQRGASTSYRQYAYEVDKFMTYNTLVVGSTLLKLEALYAMVDDSELISDYSHIALGVEHALDDLQNGATLSLISEYYKYTTYEDGKYTDLQLFENMQNDIFLGVRYALNNSDDTEIVGGVIHDLEYDEQTYYFELESRVGGFLKIAVDYYYIVPSKKELTANALLGRHQRVGVNIAYYF